MKAVTDADSVQKNKMKQVWMVRPASVCSTPRLTIFS